MDALEPLDERAAAAGLTRGYYKPVFYDDCMEGGRLVALPTTPATVALLWNRQVFEERADALRAANETVDRASREQAKYAGKGTTVVAVRLTVRQMSVAHVGDSRLYLIRNGAIRTLTSDHSWVAEQVAKGYMTEEEAERSPRRNIVTRALGIESSVDIDLAEIPIAHGDHLLLCSDGLTRGVRCRDILKTVETAGDLCDKTHKLVSLANEAGGDDNITVLLLSVQESAAGRLWHRLAPPWLLKAS
jgi:protein phosphatase